MTTANEIELEAAKFRKQLELKKSADIPFVVDDFPIASCKIASLLLCIHLLTIWPYKIIYGVSGYAKGKNDHISHYWLEIEKIWHLILQQINIIF